MPAETDLYTLGQVAKDLGQPTHKVHYVIQSRGIHPVARAGAYRLFGPSEVARIKEQLAGIDARRLTPAQ